MKLSRLLLPLLAATPPLFAAPPPKDEKKIDPTPGYEAVMKSAAAEAEFYPIEIVPGPQNVVLEASSIELLPAGKVAVGTRRGEIWIADGALGKDVAQTKWSRFASGLHEILGLAWKDGWLYVTQRPEVSRLQDTNGDGQADSFETVNDQWGINGDYHEYAFGTRFDREGALWVGLTLTGSGTSKSPLRGWCVRITSDGKMLPTVHGLRSPGGMGFNAAGDAFYTDNQGLWNGSSSLKHLKPGGFEGNPMSNNWWKTAMEFASHNTRLLGVEPPKTKSGTRVEAERKLEPRYVPPAVVLPHGHLGQSPSGFDFDAAGKFGPWGKGQLFVGEQTWSQVQRVTLEKVNGVYQGACFPFRSGFASGNISTRLTPDGYLLAGGSDRGWGSRGGKSFALERVKWTGKTPFEVREIHARPDGFELTFTQPIDPQTGADPASYAMAAWTWAYRAEYGGPEVDQITPKISTATVAPDGRSVRLAVAPLTKGHVHEIKLKGLKNVGGQPLLHTVAWYTRNEIPKQ